MSGLTLSFTSKRQANEEWLLGIPYLLETPVYFEVPQPTEGRDGFFNK